MNPVLKYFKRILKPEPFSMRDKKRYSQFDIGEYTYGDPTILKASAYGSLKIGRFCSIANGVVLNLIGDHRIDWVSTYPFHIIFDDFDKPKGFPKERNGIVIENDVWLCSHAYILSGVTIHNGAVVAAGSMVVKDVPPYAVVAGNPAQIVKYRFENPEIRDALEKIAWWNWPIRKIREHAHLIMSDRIEEFIALHST